MLEPLSPLLWPSIPHEYPSFLVPFNLPFESHVDFDRDFPIWLLPGR